jgi:small-conductance mechanosensitive channel
MTNIFTQLFSIHYAHIAIRVGLICVIGYTFISFISKYISKFITKKINSHVGLLAQKTIYYCGLTLLLLTTLSEFGFNLTALLGAAGVAGVAIGFASRTSMSNVISGIFLLFEGAFSLHDFISFDSISGTVEEIDLFSVKLRTIDNTLIRIPNELLLTKPITNFSHYKQRRLSCTITVDYQTNMKELINEVRTIIQQQTIVLENPQPDIIIDEFFDDHCSLRMRFWVSSDNVKQARQDFLAELKQAFLKKNITIHELYLGFKVPNSSVTYIRMKK